MERIIRSEPTLSARTHTRSRTIETFLCYPHKVPEPNHFSTMQKHQRTRADRYSKEKSDREKRRKERESHSNRVAQIARKQANVTWYQKMAMQILDQEWINYVYEKPIQNFKSFYLIDIYLPEYKICIEIDWSAHDLPENKEKDYIRDCFLRSKWYWIIRIRNHDIREVFVPVIKKAIACRIRNLRK